MFDFEFLMIFMLESPGSTYGEMSTESSITLIAESINEAHKATKTVTIFLKTRYALSFTRSHARLIFLDKARGKKCYGFTDVAGIIAKVEDKKRVGVCLDTCKPISLFSSLMKCIEFISIGFAFAAVCEAEVDLVEPSTNLLT